MIWISLSLLALSFLTLLISKYEFERAWTNAYNQGFEDGAQRVLRRNFKTVDELQNKKD